MDARPAFTASRRGLLTAAAALPALAFPTLATPLANSAADFGCRYFAACEAFCALSEDDDEAFERVNALFEAACDAPIVTRADAAMKVRLGALSIDNGDRSDERDVQALEQVVRWLEAV